MISLGENKMKHKLQETYERMFGPLNERSTKPVSDNDVLLDKKTRSMPHNQNDIINALQKDRKIVKHIGKKYLDGSYFDDVDFVADNVDGTTIATLKWGWKLKDLKKAILKAKPTKWQT